MHNYEAWLENGAKKKDAKFFMNCIHEPLIQDKEGKFSDVLILNVVPPAELHLLLGPVNKMYDELEKLWPEVNTWARDCKAFKCCRHGSGFNGNSCMRLINTENLDRLQMIIPAEFDAYVPALRAFGRVVNSCFGLKLSPSYMSDIDYFKRCYLNLGISVTPKVFSMS